MLQILLELARYFLWSPNLPQNPLAHLDLPGHALSWNLVLEPCPAAKLLLALLSF